jgi:hypothetical protein
MLIKTPVSRYIFLISPASRLDFFGVECFRFTYLVQQLTMRKHRDIFLGSDPAEILKLKPHKRSWILQAIRHFGNYYNYKTNNLECKELIEKIINRYGLNIGLDMHQRIYIVDDNYVVNKVKDLVAIPGEIGLAVKVGLYSGLRQEEGSRYPNVVVALLPLWDVVFIITGNSSSFSSFRYVQSLLFRRYCK